MEIYVRQFTLNGMISALAEVAVLVPLAGFPYGTGVHNLSPGQASAHTVSGICKGSFGGCCYCRVLNACEHLGIAGCRTYYH